TRRIVLQNIALALTVKGACIIRGLLGTATMWEAVFADVGVALLAILNATRVFRRRYGSRWTYPEMSGSANTQASG
ncbi:MAG: hypothetical protein WBJ25_07510, partial [Bacillota bacterium]